MRNDGVRCGCAAWHMGCMMGSSPSFLHVERPSSRSREPGLFASVAGSARRGGGRGAVGFRAVWPRVFRITRGRLVTARAVDSGRERDAYSNVDRGKVDRVVTLGSAVVQWGDGEVRVWPHCKLS